MLHPLDIIHICETNSMYDSLATIAIEILPKYIEIGEISEAGIISKEVSDSIAEILKEVSRFYKEPSEVVINQFLTHANYCWDCLQAMELRKLNKLH